MTADITVLTLTAGRPSLKDVEYDLNGQLVQPREWFVIEDTKLPAYRPKNARIFQSVSAAALYFPKMAQALKAVKTKYITFMDDDNRFHSDHIQALTDALSPKQPFVATRRVYVGPDYAPIGSEHLASELIDTNNMALETQLFRESLQFAAMYHIPHFADRQLQCFLQSRNITPVRLKDITVRYRVADRNINAFSGNQILFETLSGIVLRYSK